MNGTLYGIGVGPGDPELLTIKAVKRIGACPVLAVPGSVKEETVAYGIAAGAVPGLARKECLELSIPMTKDPQTLSKSYQNGAEQIIACLSSGRDVAFLTLGDPTVYSTYLNLHRLVAEAGYSTRIINGIPSFCAVAARLNQGLVERDEPLHVIPSSYGIEEALSLPGTKVLMKAGKQMPQVKQRLLETEQAVSMVENCGMETERVFQGAEAVPEHAGYYSLLVVKERKS